MDAHRTNLPLRAEQLHRTRARASTKSPCGLQETRLVSIVGVGGVGKTDWRSRSGLRVLHEHADGVWLCELAAVHDPERISMTRWRRRIGYTPPPGSHRWRSACKRHLERKQLIAACSTTASTSSGGGQSSSQTRPRARGRSVGACATSREALGVEASTSPADVAHRCHATPTTPQCGTRLGGGCAVRARASEAGGGRSRSTSARPVRYERVHAPGRHPAGDRARGGADRDDDAGRDRENDSTSSSRPPRRAPRRAGTAPDARGRDRLVLRPAHRRERRSCSKGCRCAWEGSTSTPRTNWVCGADGDDGGVRTAAGACGQVVGRALRGRARTLGTAC